MNTTLLVLHLLGFGAGFAMSAGNNIAMMLAARAPAEEAAGLRRFSPVMLNVGGTGLVVLWITGPILLWTKYGGASGIALLPWAFWAKIACVVLLTVLFGLIHMTLAKIKRGDTALAARIPLYARTGAAILLLIVIFAVLAFN